MIVARHDDDRLLAIGEIPESRQRLPILVHRDDQVGEQPLLLVRLGDADLVHVDPVGLRIRRGSAIELVVRTDRGVAIPLLRRPSGIALAHIDDGSSQIISESSSLPAVGANAAQRYGRVSGSRGCSRVEGSQV